MSDFSRRHYKAIAKIVKENSDSVDGDIILKWNFLEELMEIFKIDNPEFDERRFRDACC